MLGPPPPPPPRFRTWPLVVAGLTGFVVLVAAVAVTVVAAGRGPSHPDAWDPRVADIAGFVERERGLSFRHPVHVDFVPEDEFKALVTSDTSSRSDEDRKELERAVAGLRALGMLQGAADLGEAGNALRGSGVVAFYSPETERVKVRGTELTPAVRTTLAHELTHALQDQHFDLERLQQAPTATERDSFRTLAEGDAVTVEDAYVAQLSPEDKARNEEEERAGREQARSGSANVPDVLVAAFAAPYEFGPPFVAALEADGGKRRIDQAFRDPPRAESQIIDVVDFLDDQELRQVERPKVDGAVGDEFDLGWLTLYLMLVARGDPHQALAAADRWAGDAATLSERDGRVCVDATVAADGPDGAAQLQTALARWAEALPPEAGASATRDGDDVRIHSCDPGPDADQGIQGTPSDSLALPIVRLSMFARARRDGVPVPRADCIADRFVADLTVAEATGPPLGREEIQRRAQRAAAACPA